MSPDRQRLFSDYAVGQISAEDFSRLDQMLNADRELRNEFLEYMNICAFLEATAACAKVHHLDLEEKTTAPLAATKIHNLKLPAWIRAIAAAAAITFVALSLIRICNPTEVPTRGLAYQDTQIQDRTKPIFGGPEPHRNQSRLVALGTPSKNAG